MSKYSIEDSTLTAIADAMRNADRTTEKITPEEMPAKASALYMAGEKSEYDRFWDAFQAYGNRRNYQYGFSGRGWNNETFKPKYDIVVTGEPIRMFVNTDIGGSLVELLKRQSILLDTSGTNNAEYLFDSSTKITEIPCIVCNNSAAGLFNWCLSLKTASIELTENTVVSNMFFRCDGLENLTVVGTIGKGDFNLQHSARLSKASIISVINALSTSAAGQIVTFSLNAVNNAFETGVGAADGSTSTEWLVLIDTKPNWTISLV